MKMLVALLLALAWPAAAEAGCQGMSYGGDDYTVCEFDLRTDHVQLFNLGSDGQPYLGFDALNAALAAQGHKLSFAMNGGMFGPDYKPVGLYIEGGKALHKVNRANGKGNFALKPNGVFWVAGNHGGVTETEAFARSGVKPDYATQSGPMLVINGQIHPKLSPNGTSQKIRNGVGMVDDHTVEFVISDGFVTFYNFALLFRDGLNCRNALFLDGSVSSLYAPELGRNDGLARLGPIVGLAR